MLARILGSTHWLDRCVISAASMLRGLGFKIHWNPNISLCFFPEEPQDRSSQSNTNMIPCAARTGRSICRGYIRTVYGSSSWRILKASYAELAHLAFICQSYIILWAARMPLVSCLHIWSRGSCLCYPIHKKALWISMDLIWIKIHLCQQFQ